MMAFILPTDFDFIAYMSKMAFFWKLFSRLWRFQNMITIPGGWVGGRGWIGGCGGGGEIWKGLKEGGGGGGGRLV